MRRRTVWAALLFVVLALVAGSLAAPDAQAASMHPKIKQKLDQLNASKDWYAIKPGRFQWQIKVNGGWWARFERADLLYRSDLGQAYAVHGEIRRKWIAVGGPGTAGFPHSDEQAAPIKGRFNRFDDGEIHFISRPTFWIHGAIYRTYRKLTLTELRKLGQMESDERGYHGGPGGTVSNHFQFGNIFYSPGHGTSVLYGQPAMAARQAVYLGAGTMTGRPRATGHGDWMRIPFTNASAWYNLSLGRQSETLLFGEVNRHHLKRIAHLGPPGRSDGWTSGCGRHDFTKGYLEWDAQRGVIEVSGEILTRLKAAGYLPTRDLGCALTSVSSLKDGSLRQRFSGGEVTWSPSSRSLRVRWATYSIVNGPGLVPNGGFTFRLGIFDETGESDAVPTGQVELRASDGSLLASCTGLEDAYGCTVEVPRWRGLRTLTVKYLGDARHAPHTQEHVVRGWPT